MRLRILLAGAGCAFVLAAPLLAQVPSVLNYQGRLTVGGTNVTGTGAFKFALVNGDGSQTFWRNDGLSEPGEPTTAVSLSVSQGLYSVLLGNTAVSNMAAIAPAVFANSDVRLRVWFSGEGTDGFVLLAPDQRLGAAGYALRAAVADSASIGQVEGDLTVGGNLTVSGSLEAAETLAFRTDGTVALTLGPERFFGEGDAGIGGRNVVMGFSGNTIEPNVFGATIAGGGGVYFGFVLPNRVTASFGTVGGGVNNIVSGITGTVAGGEQNTAEGEGAVIAGGYLNSASGLYSTIGGGSLNVSGGEYSSALGGFSNVVTGDFAVAGGGRDHVASGRLASIAGGEANVATGDFAAVGGGGNNVAAGLYSVVSGGLENQAGAYGTVPGGYNNTASGLDSFAAGALARANNASSFVWGGHPEVETVSTNEQSFTVRAPGGTRFISTASADNNASVYLAANTTTWATLGDSNAKTEVQAIAPRDILAKVGELPVTSWRYKHDPDRRYIGPMAQDFHELFGLGADDKTISTLDSDGVMFGAIQGLLEELQERDARIHSLEQRLEDLEQRLPPQ